MSVVVVGSLNRDVVTRVAHVPGPGETVLATDLVRTAGGKGGNQAVAAKRAGGARVAFIGAIGADADGRVLRDALAADDIDVSGIEVVDAPTGTALISVADDGENAIVVAPGANAQRTALTEHQRTLVADARVLVTQLEIPAALVLDAASARGSAIHVLNAAPSQPVADGGAELLATVDVLIVNEHEMRDLSGRTDIEAGVDDLLGRVPVIVVTLGSAGCLVATPEGRRRVAAFPVDAVDTTGAGDTFCGVFAARLAAGGTAVPHLDLLVDAARAGAAAASLSVQRPGAQDSVPTAREVDVLLEAGGRR
ncbi:ribokinase [Microbacterium invictum]|uniref:Ribokinase n=1 Tax=Microbacterium invictum TaxID=515415 RepID=A0ABZ0V8P2_9MICO|nr:ribokinase [Microbacterium invictum]WQB69839.1 ribokinase [Microbacterium invictum]